MADEPGVTPEESPASSATPSPERPIENLRGEFARKMGTLEQKFNTLTQAITQLIPQQQPTPPPASKGGTVTDDDLFTLAQQGDKEAFAEWTRRQSRQTVMEYAEHTKRRNLIQGQLQAIGGKYPVLNDPNHPLTQTANTAYQLLVAQGYPADDNTRLDAIKTAIAERPDVIADLHAQSANARESARRSSVNGGVLGVSHRSEGGSAERPHQFKVTDEERALAARMGIRKPIEEVKKNFLDRREKGLSNLGAVGAHVDQENF